MIALEDEMKPEVVGDDWETIESEIPRRSYAAVVVYNPDSLDEYQ